MTAGGQHGSGGEGSRWQLVAIGCYWVVVVVVCVIAGNLVRLAQWVLRRLWRRGR